MSGKPPKKKRTGQPVDQKTDQVIVLDEGLAKEFVEFLQSRGSPVPSMETVKKKGKKPVGKLKMVQPPLQKNPEPPGERPKRAATKSPLSAKRTKSAKGTKDGPDSPTKLSPKKGSLADRPIFIPSGRAFGSPARPDVSDDDYAPAVPAPSHPVKVDVVRRSQTAGTKARTPTKTSQQQLPPKADAPGPKKKAADGKQKVAKGVGENDSGSSDLADEVNRILEARRRRMAELERERAERSPEGAGKGVSAPAAFERAPAVTASDSDSGRLPEKAVRLAGERPPPARAEMLLIEEEEDDSETMLARHVEIEDDDAVPEKAEPPVRGSKVKDDSDSDGAIQYHPDPMANEVKARGGLLDDEEEESSARVESEDSQGARPEEVDAPPSPARLTSPLPSKHVARRRSLFEEEEEKPLKRRVLAETSLSPGDEEFESPRASPPRDRSIPPPDRESSGDVSPRGRRIVGEDLPDFRVRSAEDDEVARIRRELDHEATSLAKKDSAADDTLDDDTIEAMISKYSRGTAAATSWSDGE